MTQHNRETLLALIERAKKHIMSPEEKFEQRVLLVFGQQDYDNGDRFTKTEIRAMLIEMMGRPACPKCAALDPTGEKA